jgi:hypothetical protein
MFLKEKYLATGEFEKLKARLVAGGDQQDKAMYDDLSAPTVSTSSVFTILSIAVYTQHTRGERRRWSTSEERSSMQR